MTRSQETALIPIRHTKPFQNLVINLATCELVKHLQENKLLQVGAIFAREKLLMQVDRTFAKK